MINVNDYAFQTWDEWSDSYFQIVSNELFGGTRDPRHYSNPLHGYSKAADIRDEYEQLLDEAGYEVAEDMPTGWDDEFWAALIPLYRTWLALCQERAGDSEDRELATCLLAELTKDPS